MRLLKLYLLHFHAHCILLELLSLAHFAVEFDDIAAFVLLSSTNALQLAHIYDTQMLSSTKMNRSSLIVL